MNIATLLQHYDKPGPRYTSYPTAVEFTPAFDHAEYVARLDAAATSEEPLSLYIHVPFCDERCSFCGCSVIATQHRDVAKRYLAHVEAELCMLATRLNRRRRVTQYHWGGGTPTYLDPGQIETLQGAVTRYFEIDPDAERAIEVDPRVTSRAQLERLRALGFNRLSVGVQDLTPAVQEAIGRRQTEAQTRRLIADARDVGFDSINVDLVYGLPLQEPATFSHTLNVVAELRPERIAAYSYAHVPWIRGNQKGVNPALLPKRDTKFELIALALQRLQAAGYVQIGIDHFALPHDELARASAAGTLHRNFMGYTTSRAPDMLGVGVSAIGDVGGAYAQNTKKLTAYYGALDNGRFPIERGRVLDTDDRIRRFVITQLMCNFALDTADVERRFAIDFASYFARELRELGPPAGPVADGFLLVRPERLEVLPLGRLFVRNICMTFDRYLRAAATAHPAGALRPVFSRTV
jgi:oxygen-independent coproporphyrinogen-3 oxidase